MKKNFSFYSARYISIMRVALFFSLSNPMEDAFQNSVLSSRRLFAESFSRSFAHAFKRVVVSVICQTGFLYSKSPPRLKDNVSS